MTAKRYSRNIGTITEAEQEVLRNSKIFIAGSGGLGGYILSLLLRIGVGNITIIDGDSFDESNLNRQLLSSLSTLGHSKAETAALYAKDVNPLVHVNAKQVFLDDANCDALIQDHDLVIDALDNIESRKILAKSCDKLNIPLIYGAICGWNAQVGVFLPGTIMNRMETLYPQNTVIKDKSCLSPTPSLCASVQVAEAVKYLLNHGTHLTNSILYIDLLEGEFEEIPFL